DHLPPLNICLQVKIDEEESKAGFAPDEINGVIETIAQYPRLTLRGFMTLPAPSEGLDSQRQPFRKLRLLRDRLATPQLPLETLSMGMSDDLEAAIAEGATIVRIGTAIFGPRNYPA
ncbi:MAG: alanine racemase, partial [Sedimenticola sp.]|nr:alanine racemase [Sedimenticola sp.]